MIGWLTILALLATAGPPRLECALIAPRAGDLVLVNQTVLHDATHGVTLLPGLSDEAVESFFDGRKGRLLTAGLTELTAEPAPLRLPLAAGELTAPVATARPGRRGVMDPSAVTIEPRAQLTGDRFRLELRVTLLQGAGEQNAPTQRVYSSRSLSLAWNLLYGEPLLVLLESDPAVAADGAVYRRRIGNQTVESNSPQIGLILRLLAPEAEPVYADLEPPVAPPGEIRVLGAVGRPGIYPWSPGLTAGAAIAAAGGVQPDGQPRLRLVRLLEDGVAREEYDVPPAVGQPGDFGLAPRDELTILRTGFGQPRDRPGVPSLPETEPVTATPAAPAGPSRPSQPAARPPAGPAGPAGADVGTRAAPTEGAGDRSADAPSLTRRLPLEEWRRIAPAAAPAAAAAVAVFGVKRTNNTERQVLLAGTLVTADGLIITAPADVFDGVTELRVNLQDGRELPATMLGRDRDSGLLALRIAARDLPCLAAAEVSTELGQPVVVIGHPYGLERSVHLTVVGGLNRRLALEAQATMQLDLALAGGNSGGPVVDLDGRLVAIAYGRVQSPEAGPDISLAVPAAVVARFVASLTR